MTAIDLTTNEREATLQAFAAEAQEILTGMEAALVALEARPDGRDALDSLLRSAARLEGSAGRASFAPVRDLTSELVGLIERLRARGAPPGPEHFRLFHRALVVLVEATADGLTGVAAPRPEATALRELLAGATPPPAAPASSAGYASIDQALRSAVAEDVSGRDERSDGLDPRGSPAPMGSDGEETAGSS
ncbi:MAG TPA: Hpt domain-containing protein [Anaeromyxobacteraceae bacterium]|nr:Hpt domain-containing protein [Anaeromyxobacteraceae bacterium]